MITRRLSVLCLPLALLTPFLMGQKPDASFQTGGGVSTTTIETPKGKIHIVLPDDTAAGDTISGTVTAEPAGKNDKEKQRNSAELNGYVVEIGNQKSPLSGGVIQRIHLAPEITAPRLLLLDEKGKEISNVLVPILAVPATTTPSNFVVSSIGQTGRPLVIFGPFDGDSANTNVNVGNGSARVIAESPRKVVVESPRDVVGPTKIEVTENGTTATGGFRNLKIDLTAPKTSLMKGESTELHVEVSGLEGITQPIPVQVQNLSPSTVNLSGGNTQTIQIQPSQVQTGGTFPWSTGVTGTGTGGFSITASVPTGTYASPNPAPPSTSPSPSPSPSSQPQDTVASRPANSPQGGSEKIDIEMVELQLKSSQPITVPAGTPTPTDVPTGPTRPIPAPTPTPEPTPPPRATPPQAPLPPDTRPTIPGSGQRVIPKPTPTPTPTPPPMPTPTPTPTPCDCDQVTLLVDDPAGPNKVEVTKQDDITNADGDITGKRMLVTLKLVDHEIKCKGAASSTKCSATVVWDVQSASFTFNAKGKAWDGEAAKEAIRDGAVTYKEPNLTRPLSQVDLEGSCDPKIKVGKRTITVSLVLVVTYPDELAAELKQAKANKKKVEVGEMTGSISWSSTARNCPTKFFIVKGGKRIDPGGALITQFKITGGTYTFQ
ncbi:MAG TPA: hypothetical protein VLL54_02530 [Pyrinomonadaceae bacterium]|nr:hypothetical protein [Pyrinomonadaceae bacterium]